MWLIISISLTSLIKDLKKYLLRTSLSQANIFLFPLQNVKVERIVYLATDDISVWKKEIQTFQLKGYKFIGDFEICKHSTNSWESNSFLTTNF
mgnify:CR=1 FL=1